MYRRCLFCQADLGTNEALEAFPVGRRVAYDAEKGRLWVVCRACERWNLTPLEERWEAIEEAERHYRGTRLRASTDQVGLARVGDGTELVRIGRPLRPEFAAWRYGDQFGRRRRRQLAAAGGMLALGGGAIAWGTAAGVIGGYLVYWSGKTLWEVVVNGRQDAVVARVPTPGAAALVVRRRHLLESDLVRTDEGGALLLRHDGGRTLVQGEAALRAAARLLPAANRFGGSRADVAAAVSRIEHAGGPDGYVRAVLRTSPSAPADPARFRPRGEGAEAGLLALPTSARLAVEMALHEEQERRALEGELAALEAAWREAEEIASIADTLALPSGVAGALERLRGR